MNEIIEAPLTRDELAGLYLELIDDPRYQNLPGKVEIDPWGRIQLSPANTFHGIVQMRLGKRLHSLGGESAAELPVLTSRGLLVADVAWLSPEYVSAHGIATPTAVAPDICIEIVSRSNTRKELDQKVSAYLEAGAVEAWIVFPVGQQIEFHDRSGKIGRSRFAVDLTDLFVAPPSHPD